MMHYSVRPSAVRRAGLLAVAAVSALVLLSACGGGSSSGTGMNNSGMMPSASAASRGVFNDADLTFAQQMIPHHQQALQMAAMAAGRASDAEVKNLADKIKQAQQPEIDTMNAWLTTWGQPTPMAGMESAMPGMDHGSMPGMMSDTDMARLGAAKGAAFDKQFLTMMISHHAGAITMAQEEVAKGANPDAKALAQKIITDQQAEITTMKGMLNQL